MKKACLVVLLALCAFQVHSQAIVEVKLLRLDAAQLLVLVLNNNPETTELNRNFCRGAVGGLSFDITSAEGHRYPFQVLLNEGCDLDSHVQLAPMGVVGKVFSIAELLAFHGHPTGKLNLTAQLCQRGKAGNKVNCLTSNRIEISAH
ncbi:hypothetical protein [Gallaecimonas pentaromativorans]|uniref:Uncharacterized protein n=1 Tax=Gallaecimonas pentaromativorans TaxID=584787 RepID=A0A3N1PSE7_9GAMM|nr:hypothetical protein [Gallaecimonas pentaromativorans]ROQ29687.1 hypothetical protein EDC28_10252 [Gallaecimonas pentaromativorans]